MHKIKTTIVIFELPVPKIKQHNFFFLQKLSWNTGEIQYIKSGAHSVYMKSFGFYKHNAYKFTVTQKHKHTQNMDDCDSKHCTVNWSIV